MSGLNEAFLKVEKITAYVAAVLLVVMMLIIGCDVTGRYLFNRPIPTTFEVTELVMVVVVFFPLAYTQWKKRHIDVDIMIMHLNPKLKFVFLEISLALSLIFFGLLVWKGSEMALWSWKIQEETNGVIKFPLGPIRSLIPIGSLLMCIRLLIDGLEAFQKNASVKES